MGNPRSRREIPTDIIPNILLRLPTKDFVRSSCVCKLWCSIVADPSFRKLHVAHHAGATASSEPEALLVTETAEIGRGAEASFFNLSSAKALSSHVAIPSGYHLANVCNDLLCFACSHHHEAPAVVCNPVTGETLQLPKAPPPRPTPTGEPLLYLFVLGLSTRTKEYKMFRVSIPRWHARRDVSHVTNYIDVYTLGGGGGGGGWSQRSYLSRFHPLDHPAPVHIDGNIYVPAADLADDRARAARMLVVDVATETPRWYRIPFSYDQHPLDSRSWHHTMADSFDLNGQMCLAVYSLYPRKIVKFWVMKPLDEIEGKDDDNDDEDKLYWDLRYSFFLDDTTALPPPRCLWMEHQTLCFSINNSLYKYDTRGYSSSSSVDSILFDERIDLPDAPPYRPLPSDLVEFCRWSICGGYRPSLLSPLIFDKKGKERRPQFEHTLLRALNVKLDEHMGGI